MDNIALQGGLRGYLISCEVGKESVAAREVVDLLTEVPILSPLPTILCHSHADNAVVCRQALPHHKQ